MNLDTRFIFEIPIPLLMLVSTLMYYKGLSQKNPKKSNQGSLVLAFTVFYMIGVGICTAIHETHFVISSLSDAILFSTSLIAVAQLCSQYFGTNYRLGIFTLVPLLVASIFIPISSHKPWQIHDPYFSLHILMSLSSYSFFFIASILATMHQVLWNKLKKKQFDALFNALPNYEKVEKYSFLWVLLGIFTGILSGISGYQWWSHTDQLSAFPLISFLIISPFAIIAILRGLNLLNGILFTRSIYFALISLLVIHFVGLH